MAQQRKEGVLSDAMKPSPSDRQQEEFKSTKDFGILPVPQRLRYDPDRPPQFGLMINIAFGLFSTFSEDSGCFKMI
jgi:hypothetical protein